MRLAPKAVASDADEAIDFASAYGLTPFQWQRDVLVDWLGRRKDDTWAASTCGLAVPRQNGKNAVIEVREFYGAAVLGERIVHTAHQVKTAREAFMRVAGFFDVERYPEFNGLVAEIRRANGQEAVYLKNGGEIRFIARSGPSGRGMSFDTLILDEAQDATEEELAALKYMLATSSNAQTILTGTPPDPDRLLRGYGEAFSRIRNRGESAVDARLAWTDFGIPDGPMPNLDDRGTWLACNPSLAEGLIPVDNVESERALSSDEAFARERLGWWGDPDSMLAGAIFRPGVWVSRAVDPNLFTPASPAAIGVAADRDLSKFRLAACSSDEVSHLGAVLTAPGHERGQFVSYVAEVQKRYGCAIAIDAKGPAAPLIPDLEAAGAKLELASLDEFVQACADICEAVEAGTVSHGAYPELDAAVHAAGWRDIGDRRAFARKNGDIAMLEAAALALWGKTHGTSRAAVNNVW